MYIEVHIYFFSKLMSSIFVNDTLTCSLIYMKNAVRQVIASTSPTLTPIQYIPNQSRKPRHVSKSVNIMDSILTGVRFDLVREQRPTRLINVDLCYNAYGVYELWLSSSELFK